MNYYSNILHRIKAIKDFGNIKAGDEGGWIEKEANLSHYNTCLVYNEAKVYYDAKIYNDVIVSGHAVISGNTKISDNAEVRGDTEVCDNV